MKARHLLPILAVLLFAVPVVLSATTLTIPYTDFNAGTVEHPTGYASDTWSVRLVNNLVFSSNTSIAKIFIANSTGTGFFGINVNLAPELSNPNLYSADFFISAKSDPGPSDWTHIGMLNNLKPGKAYYIRIDETGTFTVTDGINVLLTNPAVKFPAINIRTDGTDAATAGYVQVTVGSYTLTPTETVNSWIPVIIVFAMLGMALSLLKKMSQ